MTARRRAALAAVAVAAGVTVGVTGATPAGAASGPAQHVIVSARAGDLPAVRHLVVQAHGQVERTLGLIHAVAATVPAGAVAELRTDPAVREVTTDTRVHLAGWRSSSLNLDGGGYSPASDADSMYRLENIIGARRAWMDGYTGRGVDIALVDSGVAPVPGIEAGNVVQGPDLTEESQQPATAGVDTFGHGTHLAGIIAGHDADVTDVAGAWRDSSDFLGVAPDARIVSVKVADAHGVSDVSQVIAGIDWVVQHAHDHGMNIRVMNLAFGTDSTQAYTVDPLAYAAEQAWRHGIVVVTSAGNAGASSGRLTDPATDPYLIAVGADDPNGTYSTSDDTVAPFSSAGDGTRNPDLLAPGVHVQSLRAPGSYIDNTFAATGAINPRFFRGSGTSQAAAMVSGAAALVLQQRPDLTPDQVKYVLTADASPVPGAGATVEGAGLLRLPTRLGRVPAATQRFAPATGTGSLEQARGSDHVTLTDALGHTTALTGEQDIFGHPVDTTALARLEADASAWQGGVFNGSVWTGADWTSSTWASSTWASSTWASSTWASSTWASSTWASSTWASSTWASSTWASDNWSSSTWATSFWR